MKEKIIIAAMISALLFSGCSASTEPKNREIDAANTNTSSQINSNRFENGEYNFNSNNNTSIDKMTIDYAIKDGSTQEITFDAPSLDSMGVAHPVNNATIHYGTIYKSPAYEDVPGNPTAEQAFTDFSNYICEHVYLSSLDLDAVEIESKSTENTNINGYEACRSEGILEYSDYWGEEFGKTNYIAYSVILNGSLQSDEDDTIAYFILVDDPENPTEQSVLPDIAEKTINSFNIE